VPVGDENGGSGTNRRLEQRHIILMTLYNTVEL
jgi:hypothetical protein